MAGALPGFEHGSLTLTTWVGWLTLPVESRGPTTDSTAPTPPPVQNGRAPSTFSSLPIATLREQEELDAIRPDLDGNQVMELLGIAPGRLVGQAYQHLLALRMEHGPLGHDRAVAELKDWAATRGVG